MNLLKYGTRPLLLAALLATGSPLTLAQSSGGIYTVTKSTIDNGGGRSSGGAFTLNGSIGQADASLQTATGGIYQVTGGFWANGVIELLGDGLFMDGFEGN
jgi:hypothetical protein